MTALFGDLSSEAVLPQVSTPCQAKLDARAWYKTLAVLAGPFHVGVRVDTPTAAAAVEDLLGPLLAPEMDARVSPNFSVELGDDGTIGARKRLHLVYRDHEIVARRRVADEALLDLVELLDEVPVLAVTDGPVLHASGVLTSAGEAILLPASLHKALLTRRQQLADAGLELLRTRTQQLTGSPSKLLLRREASNLDRILAQRADGRTLTGTFPLRVLAAPVLGNVPFDMRPAEGVFAVFATVLNREPMGIGMTLQVLSETAGQSRFVGMPELSAGKLAAAVLELAG